MEEETREEQIRETGKQIAKQFLKKKAVEFIKRRVLVFLFTTPPGWIILGIIIGCLVIFFLIIMFLALSESGELGSTPPQYIEPKNPTHRDVAVRFLINTGDPVASQEEIVKISTEIYDDIEEKLNKINSTTPYGAELERVLLLLKEKVLSFPSKCRENITCKREIREINKLFELYGAIVGKQKPVESVSLPDKEEVVLNKVVLNLVKINKVNRKISLLFLFPEGGTQLFEFPCQIGIGTPQIFKVIEEETEEEAEKEKELLNPLLSKGENITPEGIFKICELEENKISVCDENNNKVFEILRLKEEYTKYLGAPSEGNVVMFYSDFDLIYPYLDTDTKIVVEGIREEEKEKFWPLEKITPK